VVAKIVSISEQTEYGVQTQDLTRTDRQVFLVEFEGLISRKDAFNAVYSSKDLPKPFQRYDLHTFMYAKKTSLNQMKDVPNVWNYTVEWATADSPQELLKEPELRPVEISQGTHRQQENPYIDFEGKSLVNTAGEPILHSIQRSYPTFTFVKNYKEYPKQFGKGRDFVNKDKVTILGMDFEPHTLFLPEINISSTQYESTYVYWQFSATVYVNESKDRKGKLIGWDTIIRNQGFHEIKNIPTRKLRNGKPDPFSYKDMLVAITIGTEGKPSYASTPVLLTPKGRAFRQRTAQQTIVGITDIEKYDGPVIGFNVPGQPVESTGITQDQFDKAVIKRVFCNYIDFSSFLPFK
jgi:hypothetical protein